MLNAPHVAFRAPSHHHRLQDPPAAAVEWPECDPGRLQAQKQAADEKAAKDKAAQEKAVAEKKAADDKTAAEKKQAGLPAPNLNPRKLKRSGLRYTLMNEALSFVDHHCVWCA